MTGIRPPSSSSSFSSRVRSRQAQSSSSPGGAAWSPQQRPTVVASNAARVERSGKKAPLESVVVRNDNGASDDEKNNVDANEANRDFEGGGNDIDGSPCPVANARKATENDIELGGTNVRVCVRLRPMILPSDYETALDSVDAAAASASASASATAPSSSSDGRGFARETAATMRRHTSGLATPSKSGSPRPREGYQQQQQQQQATSSWQTHPSDPRRITQSDHTASHTSHRDPGRMADYSFDRVYGQAESTSTLYDESVRGVVGSFVDGYHGSVFAYGQTNSGKTHTMTGSAAEAGVVRLAVRDVFHRIRSQSTAAAASATNDGSREYLVRVSYLEIYNEQIYDLLSQPSPSPSKFKSSLQHHHLPPSTSVRIFESRTEGVVVRGLREEIVTCPEDVFALLDAGDARRRVGCTGMNKTSSRSHSVFRLVLESRASSSKGEGGGGLGAGGGGGGVPSLAPSSNSSINSDSDSVTTCGTQHSHHGASIRGPVRISSLSLVDLAGSESVKYTGSTGVRQKEGQYINKSLLTLGHVVHKLSEMSLREKVGGASSSSALSMMAPNEHIPYRDSKLTRLLQPSLGGNAQVCIICNISPALSNLEESHNTLKFAMRAKKIRQHARITEVADEKTLLRSYREEIEELKRQLREARKTSAEIQHSQQPRHHGQVDQTPKIAVEYSSSSDDEDQDDTHVLVSAIANLESLILKAGAKSTQKGTTTTVRSNSSTATTSEDGNDESSLPSRALDAALMRAESEVASFVKPKISSPAVTNDSPATNKTSLMTPATTQRVEESDEDDHLLLEELHRIQDMLGAVMKKKRKGGGGVKSTPGGGPGNHINNPESRTPERDTEMEQLRMQLQEQEVASTMRKADSSFLQGQLNVKDGILKEVSVLLEALEKRQLALETENKQLREDLAGAANMIEEADAARLILEQRLSERDIELVEKRDGVYDNSE